MPTTACATGTWSSMRDVITASPTRSVTSTGSPPPPGSGTPASRSWCISCTATPRSSRSTTPRQVPPEAYSARFGHPTPVFARAARVRWHDRDGLLVSGTASVVGEDSHHDRFEHQLEETLRNLEVVVDRGWSGATPADLDDWLVYLPDPVHADRVRAAIAARWPDRSPTIVCRGQRLCRRELQVEIECAGFRSPKDAER